MSQIVRNGFVAACILKDEDSANYFIGVLLNIFPDYLKPGFRPYTGAKSIVPGDDGEYDPDTYWYVKEVLKIDNLHDDNEE
jgi:hypothetical protein